MLYSLRPVVSAPRRFCAPSFLLVMASLLLAVPDAQAQSSGAPTGTYNWQTTDPNTGKITAQSPTFSGGQWYSGYYNPPGPFSYESGTDSTGTGDSSGQTSSSGDLSCTFTWSDASNPADPAPSCIIVQSCYAQYYGQPPFASPPSCNDGLGDSQSGGSSGYCSKTVYSVKPPSGSAITLKLSGAQASLSPVNTGSSDYYSTVDWRVDDYPVTVALTGQSSAGQALTGQQIQATLSEPNGLPSGTKITKYTWSFSGGTPFKTWNENGVAADGKTPQQLFPLTDADKTATDTTGNGISVNPISFYDEVDKDAVTAKCAISLTFPDGTTGSVTATSVPVTFLKPTAVWKVETGNVYYSHANDAYGLYPAFGTGFPGGVYWHDVVVSVPAPFSGGTCCFTQLAQPNHQYNGTGVGPNNNANSLDNSFEYFNYTWAAGSAGTENDSPAIQVGPGNKIGDTTTANDTLQAWLMYQPTGGIWVPLQKYSYTWAVTLTWVTPGTWSVSGQNPAPPNPGPTYTPTATDTPPQWTTILANRE